jgi:hypothetical protein
MDLAGQGGPASTVHGFTGRASCSPCPQSPVSQRIIPAIRTLVTGLVWRQYAFSLATIRGPSGSECQLSASEPSLSNSEAFFIRSASHAVLSQISA